MASNKDKGRFDTRYVKQPSGCWLWSYSKVSGGYGAFKIAGKMIRAHRASWLFSNGSIPEGLLVCHKCDVPACVNPDHLFLGTNMDNCRDRDKKGRASRTNFIKAGVHINAKTTKAQVREIRDLYATGTWKQKSLAEKYGLSKANICLIVNNKAWVE